MRIRFTRGYRGRLTDETFYEAGEVAALEAGAAIVEEGAAEIAEPEVGESAAIVEEPEPEEEPAPRRGRRVAP